MKELELITLEFDREEKLICVRARVGTTSFLMVLDSGASRTVLKESLLKNYSLRETDLEAFYADGQSYMLKETEVDLELGEVMLLRGLTIRVVRDLPTELFFTEYRGEPILGFLGLDLLVKHQGILDYGKTKLHLIE